MKLASHNTLTYLKPKYWVFRILRFIARCQSKTLEEQYYNYGIRFFDFRISYDKYNNIIFKHGLVEYKSDKSLFDYLDWLESKGEKIIVRIFLEEFKDSSNESRFKHLCEYLENAYLNIKFCGGCYRTGKQVYTFSPIKYKCTELHSSVTDTYGKFDEICPWIYAKLQNKKNIAKLKNDPNCDYLMIDFVNIQ